MFDHTGCGIYVKIYDNKIELFIPFANINLKNSWGKNIKMNNNDLEKHIYNKNIDFKRTGKKKMKRAG